MKRVLLIFSILLILICKSFIANANDSTKVNELLDHFDRILYIDTINKLEKLNISKEALEISQNINYQYGEMIALQQMGVIYEQVGAYNEAQRCIRKSWEIAILRKDQSEIARNEHMFGIIFENLGNYKKALVYYNKAFKKKEYFDNRNSITAILGGIAACYKGLEMIDSALYYYNQGALYADTTNSKLYRDMSLAQIAIIYYENEVHLDSAITLLQQLLITSEKEGNMQAMAASLVYIGEIYTLQNKFPEALKTLTQALDICKKYNISEVLPDSYHAFAKLYSAQKQFNEAYLMLQKYISIKDSFTQIEENNQVYELQLLLEDEAKSRLLSEKDQKIEILEKEKRISYLTNAAYISGSTLIITIIVLILMKFRGDIKRNKAIYQMESEIMQNDIKTKEMELSYKNNNLTDFAFLISQKQEFIEEVLSKLKTIKSKKEEKDQLLKETILYIKGQIMVDKNVTQLQNEVEKVNFEFFENLMQKFPGLSEKEKQLCGLIRLGLSNKEIALLRNISVGSAKTNRHRLRLKLGLHQNQDIRKFLNTI